MASTPGERRPAASDTGLGALESQLARVDPRLALAVVLALAALVYLPTLRFALVYDDGWVLITNGFLREPDLGLLFSPEGAAQHVPDVFRPTSVLFDLATYELFGLDPLAHHATSVLLHLSVCALAYAFVRTLGLGRPVALAGTALFGVMGIHAEVVSLVSYREDMLALGLALVAACAASLALRPPHLRAGGPRLRAASPATLALVAATCMVLAVGAKASIALVPVAWWLLEATAGERTRTPEPTPSKGRAALPMACMLSAAVALALAQRFAVFGQLSPYVETGAGFDPAVLASRPGVAPSQVLAASVQIQLLYLLQALLPVGLSPEYTDFTATWTAPATLLALMGWLAIAAAAVLAWRRGHRLGVAALSTFALLALPTANLVGMPNMRADRFAYASSLPLAFVFAALALFFGKRLATRNQAWALGPLVLLLVVQGSLAIAASSAFVSNRTLWASAVRRAPQSARARAMFGLMRLSVAGQRLEADPEVAQRVRDDCARAEALDPLEVHAQICFARLEAGLGRWSAAKARFVRALELGPRRQGPWLAALAEAEIAQFDDLAAKRIQSGAPAAVEELPRAERAALERSDQWLQRASRDYPFLAEIELVRARLAQRRGDAHQARIALGRARTLRPERWETVLALVELQLDLGHVPGAYATWRQGATVLAGADPIARDQMLRRLRDAQRLGLRPDPPPAAN